MLKVVGYLMLFVGAVVLGEAVSPEHVMLGLAGLVSVQIGSALLNVA